MLNPLMDLEYEFFVVDISLLEIDSGWSYRSDALDHLKDIPNDSQTKYLKVWTRRTTERMVFCG